MRLTLLIMIGVLVLLLIFFGLTSFEELVRTILTATIIALIVRGVIKVVSD